MPEAPPRLSDRLSSLPFSVVAGVITTVAAVGTVLLHMVGAVMHAHYLSFWGIDSDLFPKSTEATLLLGYYGLFERFITVLTVVWKEVILFLAVAVVVALYIAVLFTPMDFGAGALARWIQRLSERWRGFLRRFVVSLMGLLLLPCLIVFLAMLMGLLAIVGETAGRSMAERHIEDFRKGCEQSRRPCIELRRDGAVVAMGYVLDSSESHIAIFDVDLRRARALPRDDLETVSTR